jgi:hypothetical protein
LSHLLKESLLLTFKLELIVGHYNAKGSSNLPLTAFTKWCPQENRVKTFENAEKAVDLALKRFNQSQIALLQCEWKLKTSISNFD